MLTLVNGSYMNSEDAQRKTSKYKDRSFVLPEGMQTGVYRIRNTINRKIYIGSTGNSFRRRWTLHVSQLRHGKHKSKRLQADWNSFGEKAFVFEVLEPCRPEHTVAQEQVFLDWLKPHDPERGYNSYPNAEGSRGAVYSAEATANRTKSRQTPEARKQTSEITKARYIKNGGYSAEHKAKIAASVKESWKKRRETKEQIGGE